MNIFEEFLKRNEEKRIKVGVVGDSMIDQYYDVNVKKISPEFPIPVMHSDNESTSYSLPGGAANVAYQFKNFNADVHLISAVDYGAKNLFINCGIDTHYCALLNKPIPRKKRFYSDGFPTYRWDVETKYSKKDFAWEHMKNVLDTNPSPFDVLIFSDYDKGFFDKEIVDYFRSYNYASYKIVDPKSNFDLWRGFDLIKPNYNEAKAWTGKDEVELQYDLIKKIDIKEVMITLGGKGVYSKNFEYKPKNINESPNSVIGAGDTFICFVAMALAHGFKMSEVAEIAFEMGALYVQNKHNSPIEISQILQKFMPEQAKYLMPLPPRNYSLCMTNGCFDVLHRGHIETLKFAKSQADKLVVAVNSDESVARLKPGRPINKLADRMAMLANLECVDYVVFFEEDTPYELIKKLMPDVLVKGAEYDPAKIVGSDIVSKVVVSPMRPNLSTTKILNQF